MILIISTKPKIAHSLGISLSYIGLLSYAVRPSELTKEISPRYHAAIIFDPYELPDTDELLKTLRAFDPKLPIYAITDGKATGFTDIFTKDTPCAKIAAKLTKERSGYGIVGEYCLAGLDLSPTNRLPCYFFTPFTLTPTEAMIVRLLICAYPSRVKIRDILRYVFRPTRQPEPSSVRTHISSINKKFRERFSRPLIVSVPNEGYTVLTPEIAESYPEFKLLLENSFA